MKKKYSIFFMSIMMCCNIMYSQYIRPIMPQNGQMIFSDTVHFHWNRYSNVTTYHLQVATDTAFTHLLVNADVNGIDTIIRGLWQDTTFYWRLQPQGGTYGPCLHFIYFTPRMIPNLVGWYSADSCHISDTLNRIDTLYDKSIKHCHLIQLSMNKRPHYIVDSSINNQATILYDGNDYLESDSDMIYSQPCTYFFLWKNNNEGVNTNTIFNGKSSTQRHHLAYRPTYGQLTQNAGKSIYSDTNLLWLEKFDYSLLEVCYNTTYSSLKMNSVELTYGNVGTNVMYGLVLGTTYNYTNSLNNGYVPEFLFYNNTLDSLQRSKIQQYQTEKYYGRLSLGGDIASFADSIVLTPNNKYTSYLWSTTDTTPTLCVKNNGLYWVKTINQFGYEEVDSIYVYVQVPKVKDTIICQYDTLEWNFKTAYTCQWSNGQIGPYFSTHDAGNYSLLLEDSNHCQLNVLFKIKLDSLPSCTHINTIDSLCNGNTIELSCPRTTSGYDITWSTGDTGSINTSFSQTGWYGVQVTNELGCIGKDSIYIIKKGNAPLTAFTATNICMGDSTTFTNTSTTNDGTHIALSEWYLGDGATHTPVNAMDSFKHLYDTSGMYIVTLHCVTDAGCEQEYRQSVSVYSFPQPDFTPAMACQHSPVTFANLTRSEYRVGDYTWHFTTQDSSVLALPEFTYHDTGLHTVRLIATSVMGCTDSIAHTLYVKPNPASAFTHNIPCVGTNLYLNDITALPVEQKAVNRTWSVNGVTLEGSANHAQLLINREGNYHAALTMQYLNGCTSAAEADIRVNPLPIADFTVSPVCQYDTIPISTTAMADLNYEWHYMGHTYWETAPAIPADSTGRHTLMLYVYDANRCADSALQQVTVSPSPKAEFTCDYAPQGLYTLQFTNHSLRADSYTWQFDNMGMSSEKHPVFDFLTAGTYEVSLSVANSGACTHEQKQQLILPEHRVEVSLMDFQLIEQNGTVRPQVLVLNRSNRAIPLLQYTFTYNNEQIYETDSLSLPAGEMRLYTFRTAMAAKQQADYACISLSTPYDDCPSADTDREKCLLLNKADFVQTPYPNPAHNNITLCYGLQAESEVTWQIYDVGGRQLYNCTHKQQAGGIYHKHIDIASLAQGLYILKVSIGEQVYSYKFNKQSN